MKIEHLDASANRPVATALLSGARVASAPAVVRWRIFWLLLLLSSINYIDRAAVDLGNIDRTAVDLRMGGATFVIFLTGFVGELFGGWLADKWRASGAAPNLVMRTMFCSAGLIAGLTILAVAFATTPVAVVVLLSVALFFIRWCGMFWGVPATLGGQARAGLLAGSMNFSGNIVGVLVPILIGVIVQVTGTYFLALMFFVAAACGLALCAGLIDYRDRGLN